MTTSTTMMMQRSWTIRAAAAPPPPVGTVMFYVFYDRIVPAANKYMATLFNTSATRKVVIHRIWKFNTHLAAVTGVSSECYIARITARTAGTSVTIRAEDTNDSISAGITADTNSTAVTETNIYKRFLSSGEEGTAVGSQFGEDFEATQTVAQLLYDRHTSMKGHTLRLNQGLTIRWVTATTVGSRDFMFELTDEVA